MRQSAANRAEGAVAVFATAAALWLQARRLQWTGPLWRDEVAQAALSAKPWAALWKDLPRVSCPLLYPTLLRGWIALFGAGDGALRSSSFAAGLLALAALWWAARARRSGVPALSACLLTANLAYILWGGAVRPYGLGAALVITLVAAFDRLLREPTPRRAAAAAACAVLSVQCLYQAAPLTAACAAACAWANPRARKPAAAAAGLAGLSLLPYLPQVRTASAWLSIVAVPKGTARLAARLPVAFGAPRSFGWAVWAGLAAAGLGLALRAARRRELTPSGRFAALAGGAGACGYLLFVRASGLPVAYWHLIPLICFVAVCLDLLWAELAAAPAARAAVAALATAWLLAALPALRGFSRMRQTSIDLAARTVAEEAGPKDLVVLSHWPLGISFARYYSGSAPWTTLPPLEDHSVHRYDLIAAAMAEPEPDGPLWRRAAATLAAEGSVWLVTDLPPCAREPAALARATDQDFAESLACRLSARLASTARRFEALARADAGAPVSLYEDPRVYRASGFANDYSSSKASPNSGHSTRSMPSSWR